MSLLDETDIVEQWERRELVDLRSERKSWLSVVGWLVRQQGGRVEIPRTVLLQNDRDLSMEQSPIRDTLILRSK